MFKSEPSAAVLATPLQQIWGQMHEVLKEMKNINTLEADAHKSLEPEFKAKEEKLNGLLKCLNDEKGKVQADFDKDVASGTVAVDDPSYTSRLGELNKRIDKYTTELDAVRKELYLPPSKYKYRISSNGICIGMQDFWLAHLITGVQVQIVPGKGMVEELRTNTKAGTPAGLLLDLKPVSVSLLIDSLALHGESVPSMVRSLDHVELNMELEIQVRLSYGPKTATRLGRTGPVDLKRYECGKDALLAYEWKIMDTSKFEITRLDAKGIAAAVPNSLIKMVVNSVLAGRIEAVVLDLLPKELGMLLSLYMDHQVHIGGKLCISSLPLRYLQESFLAAPVEPIRDGEAAPDPLNATLSRELRSSLMKASAAVLHDPSTASTKVHELPATCAKHAAAAIGLTPAQARSLVQAQKEAAKHRFSVLFSCIRDLTAFAASYWPAATLQGLASPHQDTKQRLWINFCELFEQLIAANAQNVLMERCNAADLLADPEARKKARHDAQIIATSMFVDVKEMFNGVFELCAKPVVVNLNINQLLLRGHAETLLGTWKAVKGRQIRALYPHVQSATTGKGTATEGGGDSKPRSSSRVSWLHFSKTAADADTSKSAAAPETPNKAQAAILSKLAKYEKDLSKWVESKKSQVRTFHSFLSRLTASASVALTGGSRGKVSACVRQVQVELAPGISLPVALTEGFYPPKPIVNVIESRDEHSPALGWAAAGARDGVAPVPAPIPVRTDTDVGRGTFSVMFAWPKTVEARPHSGSLEHDADVFGLDDPAETEMAFTAPSAFEALNLGPEDINVLATLRLHRVWCGLRIDEAALLRMVQERAKAHGEGRVVKGRHLPPLYALELGIRPAVFGHSYSATGMDKETASEMARQRPDFRGKALAGAPERAPAFPYLLGIETPSWTRLALEVAALEAFGDLPLIEQQSKHMLTAIWRGAMVAADKDAFDDSELESSLSEISADPMGSPASKPPAEVVPIVLQADTPVGGLQRSASFSSASGNRNRSASSTSVGSSGKSELASAVVSSIVSILRKYLQSEELHLSLNLQISVLAMPSAPVVEPGMSPALRDIAGEPFAAGSGSDIGNALSIAVSSTHALQPTMVPPPGSGIYDKREDLRAKPATAPSTAPVASEPGPVPVLVSTTTPEESNASQGSGAPIITAPAILIQFQLPLMTLIRDIKSINSALTLKESGALGPAT